MPTQNKPRTESLDNQVVRSPADLPDYQGGDGEALRTAAQVAAILGVRRKRVYELGIPCIRLSARTIRWRHRDVLEWVASRRVGR